MILLCTCAIYAKEKGFLDKEGWKQFKGLPIDRNTSFD
jgi:hypothetical protein